MFGEYAQIASYLQQNRDGVPYATAQDCLPAYLCPPYNPPQPWNTGRDRKNTFDDFIMVAEFSELEGPKPVMTIPKDGGVNFDKNTFAVKILAVDHQNTTDGFSITEDAQVVLSELEVGIYAFVHHLVLYDNTARGFVRPYCIAYVTTESRKLTYFYEEISRQFKKAARYLKYGNKMLFVRDLERHLKDLEHTKGYLLNQVSKIRLKDDSSEAQVNDARKNAENEMYRTLQTIRQSSTEIKEILSILKPLLTDRRLEALFRDLEEKAFRENLQLGEDKLSLQDNWFNDLSSLEELDLRCGSLNEPKVSPLTLFKPREYKPLLVETKKAKRFNAPLRGLHELCSWGAKEGLKKLRLIHEHFEKDLVILEIKRNESRMLRPRCTSISHGHCVTGNFLSDVYIKNFQNAVDKEIEGWSLYSGQHFGSTGSMESLDSFKSADDGSPLSFITFNSAESVHSSPANDISLLAETEYYTDLEQTTDRATEKNILDANIASSLQFKNGLKSNLSFVSICKNYDLDFTDCKTIVEYDTEFSALDEIHENVNIIKEIKNSPIVNSSKDIFGGSHSKDNMEIKASATSSSDVDTHNSNTVDIRTNNKLNEGAFDIGTLSDTNYSVISLVERKNNTSDQNDIKAYKSSDVSIFNNVTDDQSDTGDVSQTHRCTHDLTSDIQNITVAKQCTNISQFGQPDMAENDSDQSVLLRETSHNSTDVTGTKRDSKSKLSSMLNEEDLSVQAVNPSLTADTVYVLPVEDASLRPPSPSSEIYQTPSECESCSFPKSSRSSAANLSPLACDINGIEQDLVLKSSLYYDNLVRSRAESDTSSAFTEISIRDLFPYLDINSDLNAKRQLWNEKDVVDLRIGKIFCEDNDIPAPSASVWKPRCRLYTVGEWIHNSGMGKPGSSILEILSSYQNLHHIIFSLLCGRPVLVAASVKFEQEVIKLVRALAVFVPGTKRKRQAVLEWTSRPIRIVDLTRLKLVGICRPEKRSLESYIPCAIKKTCSIVDLEKRVITASPYQGVFISSLMSKRKLFKTDVQYLSYIKWWLMEVTSKAFIFFHSFCLSSSGSILYSHSPRDQRDSYCTTVSTVMNRLGVKDSDCDIIQHFTELVKIAKIESKLWYLADSGSIVHPLHIQYKLCQTYRC